MAQSKELVKLYQELLKESSKFKSYYYKHYFTRKIKIDFENNKLDVTKSEELLQMLRRQTTIDSLYHKSKLVIE